MAAARRDGSRMRLQPERAGERARERGNPGDLARREGGCQRSRLSERTVSRECGREFAIQGAVARMAAARRNGSRMRRQPERVGDKKCRQPVSWRAREGGVARVWE
jgi:hypothetical protein